jgi:hypothetical protein
MPCYPIGQDNLKYTYIVILIFLNDFDFVCYLYCGDQQEFFFVPTPSKNTKSPRRTVFIAGAGISDVF